MEEEFEKVDLNYFQGLAYSSPGKITCKYNDITYEAILTNYKDVFRLLSLEPINEFSEKRERYYTTDFNKDDLDEIIIGRMYVKYNNYILKVIEMTDNYVYCDIKSIPFEERELLKDKMLFNREFYSDYYIKEEKNKIQEYYVKKTRYLNEKSKIL